jgi:serine/threonine protein kinase
MSTNPGLELNELGDDLPELPDAESPAGYLPTKPTGPATRRPQPQNIKRVQEDSAVNGDGSGLSGEDPKDVLERFQVDRIELNFEDCVGSGLTAEVFGGTWRGEKIAIKKLNFCSRKHAQLKQEVAFLRETAVAAKISHPNLVKLHGVAFESQPYLLVTEFCFGGTCFNLLHENELDLELWQKLRMSCDVACAMEYLHKFRPQIIHRDLKSLNLLLAEEVNTRKDTPHVKVSDFGLAKMKDKEDEWGKMTVKAGTLHWMAPEVATGHYDEKADVYSFAMVLFEFLCQEIPFEDLDPSEVLDNVMKGNRPDLEAVPPNIPEALRLLMTKCWAHSPAERPHFVHICQILTTIEGRLQS